MGIGGIKVNQIGAKVYYEISNGNVLLITSEMQDSVEETTKEQDITLYRQLQIKNADEIDYIQLEYGVLLNTFNNAKSYKVNLDSKQLEVVYYTEDELDAIQNQNKSTQELSARVSDISSYLNCNSATIADVEDLILEAEQNKIINGGM